MAKNPAQRFQTADAMRGALRSVAPVLGEPTPFAPMIPPNQRSTCRRRRHRTLRTPSTPRSVTARPLALQPITARPVTARPVTAQPLQQPLAPAYSGPAACADDAARWFGARITRQPQAPWRQLAATAQTSAGNRRPLYITLSVVIAISGVGCGWIWRETLDGCALVREFHYCAGGQSDSRCANAHSGCDACSGDACDAACARGGSGSQQSHYRCERETARDCTASRAESSAATGSAAASAAARHSQTRHSKQPATQPASNRAAGPSRGGAVRAQDRGIRRAARGVGA